MTIDKQSFSYLLKGSPPHLLFYSWTGVSILFSLVLLFCLPSEKHISVHVHSNHILPGQKTHEQRAFPKLNGSIPQLPGHLKNSLILNSVQQLILFSHCPTSSMIQDCSIKHTNDIQGSPMTSNSSTDNHRSPDISWLIPTPWLTQISYINACIQT